DGACHVLGLAHVHGATWIAARHGAEATAARADVAEEHHRGRSLRPAFAHVGTTGLLTYRVKIELAKGLLEMGVGLAAGSPDLQPWRFGCETRLHIWHVASPG